MLDSYTGLLTGGQWIVVWILFFIVVTLLAWRGFSEDDPGNRGNLPAAIGVGALTFPFIWIALWLLFAFLDLIGWLWTH